MERGYSDYSSDSSSLTEKISCMKEILARVVYITASEDLCLGFNDGFAVVYWCKTFCAHSQ